MARKRRSGVLLHISSLPGPYGSGDFGPEAYDFAARIKKLGFSLWQTLPLTPVSEVFGESPYSSPSAFAGNIAFISPDRLAGEGLLTEDELKPWKTEQGPRADLPYALRCREDLLQAAFARMKSDRRFADTEAAFHAFCEKESSWLRGYCLFELLKEKFGGGCWADWPLGYAKRDKEAMSILEEENKEALAVKAFGQFIFFSQLERLCGCCASLGIELMGDLPIYAAWDSADVWQHPEYYDLDADGRPNNVAGVPPDYFSPTGQRWGNPLYDWQRMKLDGYAWWRARIAHWLRFCGLVRIDHFRGLCGYWSIPAGEKTAVNGEWRAAEGGVMLEMLWLNELRGAAELPLVAEDLGIITDDVRELMAGMGLPGMKVLMFAFGDDTGRNPYAPHNIDECSVVYTGTHDNDTAAGWWAQSSSENERRQLALYSGFDVERDNVSAVLIREALASRAFLAVIPAQDLLGLDGGCRMNVPSKPNGNWVWRLTPEQTAALSPGSGGFAGGLKKLNEIYGRCSDN